MRFRTLCATTGGVLLAAPVFGQTTSYTYDALGRVTNVSVTAPANATTVYAYDAAGNRKSVSVTATAARTAAAKAKTVASAPKN